MATETNGRFGGKPSLILKGTGGPREPFGPENADPRENSDSPPRVLPRSDPKAPPKYEVKTTSEARSQQDNLGINQGDLVARAGVTLNGTITTCGTLTVEGEVKARLRARQMVIPKAGSFTGSAEVEEAEIAGRFEGTLRVSGKLTLRRTGRLKGRAFYGQLEIEPGGELHGRVTLGLSREKDDIFSRAFAGRF